MPQEHIMTMEVQHIPSSHHSYNKQSPGNLWQLNDLQFSVPMLRYERHFSLYCLTRRVDSCSELPSFTRPQEGDRLFGGTCFLSFLKRTVTHRIKLLCLQGLRMRFKRGARSRGKPGKLQLCYLELYEHRRGKQMMLREWSLKAVYHVIWMRDSESKIPDH